MPKVKLSDEDIQTLTDAVSEVYTDGVEYFHPYADVEDDSLTFKFEDWVEEDEEGDPRGNGEAARRYVKRFEGTFSGLPDEPELSYRMIARGWMKRVAKAGPEQMTSTSPVVQLEAIDVTDDDSELSESEFDELAAIDEEDVLAEVEEIADPAS